MITKEELIALTNLRVMEARTLACAGLNVGACYLLGYAAECAIKAVLASQFRADAIPDKNFVEKIYSHKLAALLIHAKLKDELDKRCLRDPAFAANWNTVQLWTEQLRYRTILDTVYSDFEMAVLDEGTGILPWIRTHW
jgi:hypothetical protein